MTMPTNSKTWTFNVNNSVNTGNAATDTQNVIFQLVRAMVSSGCTVVRCSYWNGSAFVVSNSDNWDVITKMPATYDGGSAARPWAVVQLPSIFGGGAVSVLIDMGYYYAMNHGVYLSYTGYNLATGTTTTRPSVTSGTQVTIAAQGNGQAFCANTTTKKIYNCLTSSDNQVFRFFVFNEGYCTTYFEFGKLKSPVPGLTSSGAQDDYYFLVMLTGGTGGGLADRVTYALLYNASTSYCFGNIAASGNTTLELSGECRMGATTPATVAFTANPNPKDNNSYPLLPIGVWSSSNSAYAWGRLGELFDVWWGSSSHVCGSTYPGDGTKTHIKLGQAIVVPWNGSSPVIS